ncbi:hypothetical protein BDV93DRAFT_505583 [Ceratobasidium sp. AG-I]|nr:hypothetical protein BDV93DRAFT_505583 [Ceratobasidium sp. AG-I]
MRIKEQPAESYRIEYQQPTLRECWAGLFNNAQHSFRNKGRGFLDHPENEHQRVAVTNAPLGANLGIAKRAQSRLERRPDPCARLGFPASNFSESHKSLVLNQPPGSGCTIRSMEWERTSIGKRRRSARREKRQLDPRRVVPSSNARMPSPNGSLGDTTRVERVSDALLDDLPSVPARHGCEGTGMLRP